MSSPSRSGSCLLPYRTPNPRAPVTVLGVGVPVVVTVALLGPDLLVLTLVGVPPAEETPLYVRVATVYPEVAAWDVHGDLR